MRLDYDIGQTRVQPVERPAVFLHVAIFLPDGRVVGDETFRLVSLQGQESISTPFEFRLVLHGNTDPAGTAPRLRFADIIGRRVTFAIERPVDSDRAAAARRFQDALDGKSVRGLVLYNGMATAFAMQEPGVYRLTVKPALWKLTLANHYRIYAQKNVRDAIAEVCARHRVPAVFDKVGGIAVARVQDWLQAGESDYEFVQRLMSKAHLYYYFEHDATGHRVVFANVAEYPEVDGGRDVRYTYTSTEGLGDEEDDVITEYGYEQTLTHSGVDGVFARQEAAWEHDTVAGFQVFRPLDAPPPGELTLRLYKIYQYGCSDAMVSEYAGAAADAIAAQASQFSGASQRAQFRAGYKFRAVSNVDKDNLPRPVRPTLDGQWFVLTQVNHEATLDGGYRNQFVATEAQRLVASFSLHDTHQGSLLAKVVAVDSGDSAPTDWRYYKKNNFDPGDSTATDAGSEPTVTDLRGVYVRFSSDGEEGPKVWVKLAPHMQTVPEIGVTVLVARAGDESELPEIQSIVQANGQMTVTPSRWTADTRVGSSYSTIYGDGKSIHFGAKSAADLQNAIKIVNAQYDTGEYREVSYSQGAHYAYDTSENGRDGLLSRSESYGSTYSRAEAAVRESYEDIGRVKNEQKIGDAENTMTVTGTDKNTTRIGISKRDSWVGVSTESSMIGVANSNNLIGLQNGNNMIGLQNSNALTGVIADMNIAGSANRLNVTGVNVGLNAAGASLEISTTGASTSVTMRGASTLVDVAGASVEFHGKPATARVESIATDISLLSAIKLVL